MQDWLRDRLLGIRLERVRTQSRAPGPTALRPAKRIETAVSRARPPVWRHSV